MIEYVPQSAHRILEIGCGSGAFGRCLRMNRADIEIWGVEPVAQALPGAQPFYDRLICDHYPPRHGVTIPHHHFDCIVMNDVLEHLVDPRQALDAALLHLNDEGLLIASIPNVRHIDVVWPLVARGQWTYRDAGILDRTHLRFFTRASIYDLFAESNFTVETLAGINLGPGRRYQALAWALARKADQFFYPQYAVVAKPRVAPRSG